MSPHPTSETLPTWQGVALLVAGIVLALFVPALVRLNVRTTAAINRWWQKTLGLEQTPAAAPVQARLTRWQYASNLFMGWLLAALLVILGIAALLKQPFGTT